jgi:hypothetical protein
MNKEHEISFILNENDYKMLFQLKKRPREKLIHQIFDIGYNIYFPSVDKELTEQQEIVAMVKSLKNEFINTDIGEKISSLEISLSKLIGISSNSSKKGEFAENVLEEIINTRYGDIEYKDMSKVARSGDGWLTFPGNQITMLESKNYTTSVSKDELDKMERDMIEHNIKWGIFVSWNSNIIGKREFDIHTFSHKGNNYVIIIISNLSKDSSRLDLAIQLLRKLRSDFDNVPKFPWIVSNITEELNQLNEIVLLNYQLRDAFEETENEIKSNLSIFYNKLRDYQYKLVKKSQDILNKIQSTMEDSIIEPLESNTEFLEEHKEKKIFPFLVRLFDNLTKLNWGIIKEDDELYLIKTDDNKKIGKLKIFLKKLVLSIDKFNILFEIKYTKDDFSELLESITAIKNISDII